MHNKILKKGGISTKWRLLLFKLYANIIKNIIMYKVLEEKLKLSMHFMSKSSKNNSNSCYKTIGYCS